MASESWACTKKGRSGQSANTHTKKSKKREKDIKTLKKRYQSRKAPKQEKKATNAITNNLVENRGSNDRIEWEGGYRAGQKRNAGNGRGEDGRTAGGFS